MQDLKKMSKAMYTIAKAESKKEDKNRNTNLACFMAQSAISYLGMYWLRRYGKHTHKMICLSCVMDIMRQELLDIPIDIISYEDEIDSWRENILSLDTVAQGAQHLPDALRIYEDLLRYVNEDIEKDKRGY